MTWWTLLYYSHTPKPTSLRVLADTNYADHLFMAWSFHKPSRVPIYVKVRGVWKRCGFKYIWDTPNITEQRQNGDTFTHGWHLPDLPEHSTIWYYLFAPDGPYGLQIQGPLMHAHLPWVLYWAPNMIVATKLKGIYHTRNFSGPEGDHPTWERINAGLDSLRIFQLHRDLYEPYRRQYCVALKDGHYALYHRDPFTSPAWNLILTRDLCLTLTGASGGSIRWVCTNFNRPGYLYVLFNTAPHPEGLWVLRSPDYGHLWTAHDPRIDILVPEAGNIMCGVAQGTSEHPAGDVIYIAYAAGLVTNQRIKYSADNASTWLLTGAAGRSGVRPRCHVDPTNQQTIYLGTDSSIGHDHVLYRSEDYTLDLLPVSTFEDLAIILSPEHSQMWIHPTNSAFMKVLAFDHVWQSWDYCASWEDLGEIMVHAEHLHVPDATPGYIYLGRNESAPLPPDAGWPHVMFASDDHGATMSGKCGPHAQQSDGGGDSIPYDCGGIAFDGMLPLY